MLALDECRIRQFRAFLDQCDYDAVVQKLRGPKGYFSDPLARIEKTDFARIDQLDEDLSCIGRLMHCGDPVRAADARRYLGEDVVANLQYLGVLKEDAGYIRTDNLVVVSFMDNYFMVQIPFYNGNCQKKDADVYIGMDSYRLAEQLPSGRINRVLDLCAGSGIQAIVQAHHAKRVTAVELNPYAAHMCRFNAILNGVSETVNVSNSSLFSELAGEEFELIVSNPPFLPVPVEMNFSKVGDGGEDGLDVVREIVKGLNAHLAKEGKAIIAGEALCRSDGTSFLAEMLQDNLPGQLKATVIFDSSISLESYLERCQTVSAEMEMPGSYGRDTYVEHYLDRLKLEGITKVVSFTVRISRDKRHSEKVRVIDLSHGWESHSTPCVVKGVTLSQHSIGTIYGLKANGRHVMNMGPLATEFMRLCDGNRTLKDIFEDLSGNERCENELAGASMAENLERLSEIAAHLELRGLIRMAQ